MSEGTPGGCRVPGFWGEARRGWVACALLAALTCVAHFWRAGSFGIYEDDWAVVPMGAAGDWGAIGAWLKMMWGGYMHGRPVGHTVWTLVPALGYPVGGVHAIYVAASLIVAANVVLFYLLLRRCWGAGVAVLGGAAFCLFPADTTRAMLVHATLLQVAVLWVMVAAHLYLSGRRAWAYGVAGLVLVTYESPFLPWLLVPAMVGAWDRRKVREMLVHWGICAGLIAVALGVRVAMGEAWVAREGGAAASLPVRVLNCLWIGPATSGRLWVERAVHAWTRGGWGLVVGAWVALGVGLWAGMRRSSVEGWGGARWVVLGGAMWVGAYGLAFPADHYPPTAEAGRMTSVHLAAAFGASIVVGWVLYGVIVLAGRWRARAVGVGLVAGYLAALVGFAFQVQEGYVVARRQQGEVWRRVLELCPDMGEGTVIVMEGVVRPRTWYALPSSWSDPLVLPAILKLPGGDGQGPVLVRARERGEWVGKLRREGGAWVWGRRPLAGFRPAEGEVVGDGEVILLRVLGGKIEREEGEVEVAGERLRLKGRPGEGAVLRYEKGVLYSLMEPMAGERRRRR